ncbi:GNAT family N-acetyltransferase [Frigidibacter sp. ROC022]|uniref:GNAT family N-acetyltransferase n=1 Tax=Frigidibacter sp. ROC022 TaxID=2971796 RepID=UPI00215B3C27|nr:GNAT family N-acetyltransferase [Frigidibacter sp. ROC022]MCR8722822.1 GNAT family N-acetyltransferase [Frigidibacter sp. ROC022]
MTLRFRDARRADVPAVVALLRDDALGAGRETAGPETYLAAFDEMAADPRNRLVVGEDATGRIVATFQFTVIAGLSLRAARRAQIESVRVAADLRGHGIGAALMAEAEARARAAGCSLLQLTSNASRGRAQAFYEQAGMVPSHIGYKKPL